MLSPWVSHYTVDLLQHMGTIVRARDLDAGWALPDLDAVPEISPTALVPSTDPDARRSLDDVSIINHASDTPVNVSVSSLVTASSATDGSNPPPSLASNSDRAVDSMTSVSTPSSRPRQGSDPFGPDGAFAARKSSVGRTQATLLDLSTMLMDADETLIARSITRQAWEIFSQIEVRRRSRNWSDESASRSHPLRPRAPRQQEPRADVPSPLDEPGRAVNPPRQLPVELVRGVCATRLT